MIDIDNRSYPEIRKAFSLKKAEWHLLNEKRAENRANLSEDEKELLDRQFLATFNEIIQEKSTDVELLKELLAKGARTTLFNPDELSGGDNFAQALKEWIKYASFSNEYSAIAQALDICLEAGDAFLTNKYYVGNGGALSVYLIFELVAGKWVYITQARKESTPDETFVLHLLFKMALLADDQIKFWEEFYLGLQLLLKNIDGQGTQQENRIARFGLHCLVYESPAFIRHYFTQELDYNTELVHICRSCFSAFALLEELLENASASEGIFGNPSIKEDMNKVLTEKWPKMYGIFLSSSASRKKIADLLKSSAWVRNQFLSQPDCVFKLVKEKEVLLPLLKKERHRMLNLRNDQGDNLLIALCKAQGKTENLVELLLRYGFDPAKENDKGESALSLAQQRRKETLLLILER